MPATVVIEEIVHLLEKLFDFRKHKLQIARPVVLSERKNHGDFVALGLVALGDVGDDGQGLKGRPREGGLSFLTTAKLGSSALFGTRVRDRLFFEGVVHFSRATIIDDRVTRIGISVFEEC